MPPVNSSSQRSTSRTTDGSHRSDFVRRIRSAPINWRATSSPTYRSCAIARTESAAASTTTPDGSNGGTVAHADATAGSATPLTSMMMCSGTGSSATSCASASWSPEPIVQHTHPFGRLRIWPFACRRTFGQRLRVDADRAEVVHDHTEPPATGVTQQVVDEGGLAGAEVSADDGQRDRLGRQGRHGRHHQSRTGGAHGTNPPATSASSTIPARLDDSLGYSPLTVSAHVTPSLRSTIIACVLSTVPVWP